MWVDSSGVTHTIGLPDPALAMSAATVRSLTELQPEERQRILDALDDYYWDEYVEGTRLRLIKSRLGPKGRSLPDGYIKDPITSAEHAIEVVRATEPAWLLDVFEALQDLLEKLNDDPLPVLARLPKHLSESAIVDPGGEVRWPLGLAADAVNTLANLDYVVLGLDVCPDLEGAVTEVPLSAYDGGGSSEDVETARALALSALDRVPELGFRAPSILVTWTLART